MSWVSVAVFQTVIASQTVTWCVMWQNATMHAGHGLYKQFTRLFLFLQKWVWLTRLGPNKVWRPQCLQGSIFCWDWSILASFSGLQFLILYCKRSKPGSREGSRDYHLFAWCYASSLHMTTSSMLSPSVCTYWSNSGDRKSREWGYIP